LTHAFQEEHLVGKDNVLLKDPVELSHRSPKDRWVPALKHRTGVSQVGLSFKGAALYV
jgi:hypothetical protein